jgi:hypothetical protein
MKNNKPKMSDLTCYAAEGYNADISYDDAVKACPHYTTSPAGMAWLVGVWLKNTGRSAPRDVRMSRGYTIHANDMLLSVDNVNAIERIK